MSTTSKSPRKVALVALDVGKDALADYSHRFSPKVFTQAQLFACLVLKEFFRTDYRGMVAILADSPDLRQVMGLKKTPHFTTLQKASQRLLRNAPVQALLDATLTRARPRGRRKRRPRVRRAALDSSGFETHHISHYFVRRRAKGRERWQTTTYKRFPKLGILCDCDSHLILSAVAGRGPGPDITHFERAILEALARVRLETLYADLPTGRQVPATTPNGVHLLAREVLDVRTIIPAGIGRPTDKPPTGHYRRLMSQRLHLTRYGQRWQDETVFSMVKRRLGSAVNARTYSSQCRALMLKAVTHNILVVLCALRSPATMLAAA